MNCAEILVEHEPVPDLPTRTSESCNTCELGSPVCRAKNFVNALEE
jgi:hypothetical protein